MRRFLSLAVNRVICVAVLAAWCAITMRFNEHGLPVALVPGSAMYLKYYTVISNLLAGLTALMYVVTLQLKLCGVISRVPGFVRLMKFVTTAMLALTFLTVLVFIGPRTGFRGSYGGVNLWFHLIVPLLAALDYALLDREGRPRFWYSLTVMLPTALYGAGYLSNLAANGYNKASDWYGFAQGGPKAVPVVIGIMLTGSWIIGILLWLPRRARKSRVPEDNSGTSSC